MMGPRKKAIVVETRPAVGKPWTPSREKMRAWFRLRQSAESIAESKSLDDDDRAWIANILTSLSAGMDVRPMFLDPPSRGRSESANDREFWIAVDALFEFKVTGKKGKTLWGELAKRWGIPDGSIKNAIGRQRLYAADMFANLPGDSTQNIEYLRKILPDFIEKHKKSP
jgi:hypothetical protein